MRTLLLLLSLVLLTPLVARAEAAPNRLYTLDCGHLQIDDMGIFFDTGEHAGERGEMAVPCFLIRHGDDWMLWDTGLGDRLAALPDGEYKLGGRWTARTTLAGQLSQLGLKPGDIKFVGLSHLHADHSGNVALFPKATWLLAPAELQWSRVPGAIGVDPSLVAALRKVEVRSTRDDLDVFGDGSVRVLRAPGHTPGHRILLLKLPKAGAVLLSGDLFHTRENFEKSLVPAVNVSRADTLASMARFAGLAQHEHARVIIQHAPEDFAALPAFPAYLD